MDSGRNRQRQRIRQPLRARSGQGGQIIIEYILLLVITAGIAAFLVRALGSRSPDNPGLIIQKWIAVSNEIGKDLPDKCVGESCAH